MIHEDWDSDEFPTKAPSAMLRGEQLVVGVLSHHVIAAATSMMCSCRMVLLRLLDTFCSIQTRFWHLLAASGPLLVAGSIFSVLGVWQLA